MSWQEEPLSQMQLLAQEGSQIKVLMEYRKIWKCKGEYKSNAIKDVLFGYLLFGDYSLTCDNKTINKDIEEIFLSDSGYMSQVRNSIENMTRI